VAEDFASAAARFCAAIEAVGRIPRRRWLAEVEAALADVYASGVRLPDAGRVRDDPGFRMTHEEWSGVFDALRTVLGAADRYRVVFDPQDESSVEASLADDLADVYRDLKGGLDALHSGTSPENLLFEWRLGFETDWARHALGALSALRAIAGLDG
jgi:hypothetical protein